MKQMDVTLLFFICITCLQIISAILHVKVRPKEKMVLEGETLTARCKIKKPISSCYWELITKTGRFCEERTIKKLVNGGEIKYHKQNFKTGKCRITILNVTEKHNGTLRCTLVPALKKFSKVFGNVLITVAKPISYLHLDVNPILRLRPKYVAENDVIKADCIIEFVRPPPEIAWFIGNDRIKNTSEIGQSGIFKLDFACDGLKRLEQNLVRSLKFSDNGKDLKCVVRHMALRLGGLNQASHKLHVYFKPKFRSTRKTAFSLAKIGKVAVTIQANPKPSIEWLVDGVKILEGNRDATRRYIALNFTDKEQDTWDAVLYINKVTPQDFEKTIILTASNEIGKEQYNVSASLALAAKAPRPPQIKITAVDPDNSEYEPNIFEENKRVLAECTIEYGRPVAKISWFFGDEKITDGLSLSVTENVGPEGEDWKTVRQNLTKTLTYLDNEKYLRCVSDHIALRPDSLSHAIKKLNVSFSPKPESGDINECNFTYERRSIVSVRIQANPKPEIEWLVDGYKIVVGDKKTSAVFQAVELIDKGKATWDAELTIFEITDRDVERNYTLRAENRLGQKEYRVNISACTGFPTKNTPKRKQKVANYNRKNRQNDRNF